MDKNYYNDFEQEFKELLEKRKSSKKQYEKSVHKFFRILLNNKLETR